MKVCVEDLMLQKINVCSIFTSKSSKTLRNNLETNA